MHGRGCPRWRLQSCRHSPQPPRRRRKGPTVAQRFRGFILPSPSWSCRVRVILQEPLSNVIGHKPSRATWPTTSTRPVRTTRSRYPSHTPTPPSPCRPCSRFGTGSWPQVSEATQAAKAGIPQVLGAGINDKDNTVQVRVPLAAAADEATRALQAAFRSDAIRAVPSAPVTLTSSRSPRLGDGE